MERGYKDTWGLIMCKKGDPRAVTFSEESRKAILQNKKFDFVFSSHPGLGMAQGPAQENWSPSNKCMLIGDTQKDEIIKLQPRNLKNGIYEFHSTNTK